MAIEENVIVKTLLQERVRLSAGIWAVVRETHATEEIYQDVIVKALASRAKINDEKHLVAWARRTGRNLAIDHLRRHRDRYVVLEETTLDLLQEGLRGRETDELDNRLDALHLCLDKLPSRTREVLDLRYGKGFQGTKVAGMMNRTVDAIYQVLSRAHHSLRDCIEKQLATLGTMPSADSPGERR
jgi:RNA polymerase sigma-70 factor (ECF subfamily)